MHAVQLERMLGEHSKAQALVEEAIQLHPKSPKIWMIYGQLILEASAAERPFSPSVISEALQVFEKGRRSCPKSVPLWLCSVDVYRQTQNWNRARALLEEVRKGIF